MKEHGKESLFDILTAEGLLDEKQIKLIKSKESLQRSKILKSKAPGLRRSYTDHSFVSLIDIIESLKLSSSNTNKPITADIIMEAVAKHLNLPFMKIDPLKLDFDVVTQFISRPYAIRNQLVTIGLSDNTLTVAIADPFETEAIDRIQRITGHEIKLVVTTKLDIMKTITEFYGFKSSITSANKECKFLCQ